MQIILERLTNDDQFLDAILQTSYFSWQQKYLQVLVRLGNLLIPRKKPWQTRDIILLLKNKLSKVHLVAALIKHSKDPGYGKYTLDEKELIQLGNFINQPDGDFVNDLIQSVSSFSNIIKERANNFIYLLDPKQLTILPKSNERFLEHSFSAPIGLHQGDMILESVNMNIMLNPQPLIPIFKSISNFINNNVKIDTQFNYTKIPNSTVTIEEIYD